MTILIFSSHPALRYVLERTAPRGASVRTPEIRRGGRRKAVYAIEIDSRLGDREPGRSVLRAWIPAHLQRFGAHRVEVDGRPLAAGEMLLPESPNGAAAPGARARRAGRR